MSTENFECVWCQRVTDEEPLTCRSCGELKCPRCIKDGECNECVSLRDDMEDGVVGVGA